MNDVWLPEKVESTYLRMLFLEQRYGNGTPLLVHTDLKVVDKSLHTMSESFAKYQNLKPTKMRVLNRLLVQNSITGCTIMINRALKNMALPIPEGAIMHDWWLGLVASAMGFVEYIDVPTVSYRQHNINVTGAKRWGLRYIIRSFKELDQRDASVQKTVFQAKSFLSLYKDKLGRRNLRTVRAYANLDKGSFFLKRYVILRNRFLKKGLARNIGMLIRI